MISTPTGPTAVAGYPWFGEWSRDTMTSYEGLFLATGRADEGAAVLRRAAATLSEGMLANTADTGTLEYNTADGTLWFLHALGRHVAVTGDDDLAAELAPTLARHRRAPLDGTRFGIGVDPADGLLAQGADGWALTWMDARIDGVPVTPRARQGGRGQRALDRGAQRSPDSSPATDACERRSRRLRRARSSRRFARADGLGLLDVVDGPSGDDASVRPNQLLAVSLPARAARGRARARRGASSTRAAPRC